MKKNETIMKQDSPQARIRARRKELKLSLQAVGDKIGKCGQYIGQLERGKKNLTDNMINSLSEALGVLPEYIQTGSEKKTLYDYSDLIDKEKSDMSYLAALTMVTSITFEFTCWVNSKKKSINVTLEQMIQYSFSDIRCCFIYEGKKTNGIIISVYVEIGDSTTKMTPLQFLNTINQTIDYSNFILRNISDSILMLEMRKSGYEESIQLAETEIELENMLEEIVDIKAEIEKEKYFEALKFSPNSHHQNDI